MTYEQYWDGQPEMAKYYRKAHEARNEQRNQEMWWMGIYVRDALLSTVGNMLAGKGHKPIKYPDAPYPITEEGVEKYQEEQQRKKMERIFNAFMKRAKDIP